MVVLMTSVHALLEIFFKLKKNPPHFQVRESVCLYRYDFCLNIMNLIVYFCRFKEQEERRRFQPVLNSLRQKKKRNNLISDGQKQSLDVAQVRLGDLMWSNAHAHTQRESCRVSIVLLLLWFPLKTLALLCGCTGVKMWLKTKKTKYPSDVFTNHFTQLSKKVRKQQQKKKSVSVWSSCGQVTPGPRCVWRELPL